MRWVATLIGAGTIIALVGTYFLVGNIPVGEGAGWDGLVYLNYIEAIGNGNIVAGDFYRLSRTSAFVPLIVASALGTSHERLIDLQTAINIVTVSMGVVLFHNALLKLGAARNSALISTLILIASWPVLVMPVFYPILADNVAIPISCLSIWLWARGWTWPLYVLIACGLWIMPGLFLIPFVLALLPRGRQIAKQQTDYRVSPAAIILFALTGSAFLALAIPKLLPYLTNVELQTSLSVWGRTAITELLPITLALSIAAGLGICWLAVRVTEDAIAARAVPLSNACWAGIPLILSGALMWLCARLIGAYVPPPLIKFMALQSLAAPLKPMAAHFIYFGPIILLTVIECFRWSIGHRAKIPRALLVVFVGFTPLLAFGSESRQWISILPVAVAIVALSEGNRLERLVCLGFSVLLIVPLFWLRTSTTTALHETQNYQDPLWQVYFGRHGPWMSVETYQLILVLIIVYLVIHLIVKGSSNDSADPG